MSNLIDLLFCVVLSVVLAPLTIRLVYRFADWFIAQDGSARMRHPTARRQR